MKFLITLLLTLHALESCSARSFVPNPANWFRRFPSQMRTRQNQLNSPDDESQNMKPESLSSTQPPVSRPHTYMYGWPTLFGDKRAPVFVGRRTLIYSNDDNYEDMSDYNSVNYDDNTNEVDDSNDDAYDNDANGNGQPLGLYGMYPLSKSIFSKRQTSNGNSEEKRRVKRETSEIPQQDMSNHEDQTVEDKIESNVRKDNKYKTINSRLRDILERYHKELMLLLKESKDKELLLSMIDDIMSERENQGMNFESSDDMASDGEIFQDQLLDLQAEHITMDKADHSALDKATDQADSDLLTSNADGSKLEATEKQNKTNSQNKADILTHETDKESTFRFDEKDKRRPKFVGKRDVYGSQNRLEMLDQEFNPFSYDTDKRRVPGFVGKRMAPRFVGKRKVPGFVGKRRVPGFVGKRKVPGFVGKRLVSETIDDQIQSMLDKIRPPSLDGELRAPEFIEKRRAPGFVGKRKVPGFVGKRLASGAATENLLGAELEMF